MNDTFGIFLSCICRMSESRFERFLQKEDFLNIMVEPIGHIHDNIHEDDPGMIEATFKQHAYHKGRE